MITRWDLNELAHDDENELYHYGVKGMRWGKHLPGVDMINAAVARARAAKERISKAASDFADYAWNDPWKKANDRYIKGTSADPKNMAKQRAENEKHTKEWERASEQVKKEQGLEKKNKNINKNINTNKNNTNKKDAPSNKDKPNNMETAVLKNKPNRPKGWDDFKERKYKEARKRSLKEIRQSGVSRKKAKQILKKSFITRKMAARNPRMLSSDWGTGNKQSRKIRNIPKNKTYKQLRKMGYSKENSRLFSNYRGD